MSDAADGSRLKIPADLERRILVEAGHRCAIPTCRHIDVEIHHIIPWSKCQEHSYDNLIALCPNCHRRADGGKIDRKSLRLYKYNLRFAHDKFSQLELDVLFCAYKRQPDEPMDWPPFVHILINRILAAGYVEILPQNNGGVFVGGMRSDPDHIRITDDGRKFVKDIGLIEM